ncbi:HNH endonuclease signature motif containing protein [Brachybacterium paraconglomeratum]|uniref:HNH endonuclease signature motif containing protein n=1 Tax=Brachybacterium paraconglomeratum TaxID=173362 RepID=UPI0021A89BCE|nr:HNH endonuclease signature motif containing protein [Brachybacterium paraconglomeratum]MCT1909068.1 HNH endonuclease [Brachybacterium paraconglomeratum]
MGEFDEAPQTVPGTDTAVDTTVAADPAVSPAPRWRVRARRPLDEEQLLAEVEPGTIEASRVLALHRTMQTRARLYAHELRQLATFFREDPETGGIPENADMTGVKVAVGLRTCAARAWSMVLDARTSVDLMPATFAHLARGDMPEDFHRYLLRQVRRLDDAQKESVDRHLAGVEIPAVSKATFEAQVRLAVRLATAGAVPEPPRASRSVEIVDVDTTTGTASLCVTGPILEIQGLAHRLDVAARTVQKAQRAALQDDAEGRFPFDIDGDLAERGRALSLATLRYAILTHSVLDIDPVQETRSPYKVLVTVPVTTLMGLENTPAMLDGLTPIPAELARDLAAGESTWLRILTDPIIGAPCDAVAESYAPTAQMRLQLRMRHPVCAVPGCGRPTRLAAEDDHILEYDHDHPDEGGQTSLANLHRLCWRHHQLKTAGLLDPTRVPDPSRELGGSPGPVATDWEIDGGIRARTVEHTDLVTPVTAEALEAAWRIHQRLHADAERLAAAERARPRRERVNEQRREAMAIAHPHLRSRLRPPDPDALAALGDPPF